MKIQDEYMKKLSSLRKFCLFFKVWILTQMLNLLLEVTLILIWTLFLPTLGGGKLKQSFLSSILKT